MLIYYNNSCARRTRISAGVAELADAPDLGSGALGVKVRVLSPAPISYMREWLSGRASPCQGECREFESRLPLHDMKCRSHRSGGNVHF